MSYSLLLLCALGSLAIIQAATSPEQKLGLKLLKDVDPRWRPVMKAKDVVEVTVMPAVVGVVDYDDDRNTLGLHLFMLMTWNNPFMTWNPKEHDGLEQLNMPAKDVWIPDLESYSSTTMRKTRLGDSVYSVLMMNDGTNILVESEVYRSHNCTDHNDEIDCQFTFGSWVYSDEQLDVKAEAPMTKYSMPNEDYNIDTVTFERNDMKYPEFDNRNYPQLVLKIHLSEDSDSSEESHEPKKKEL